MATFKTFADSVDMTQLGILDDFTTATFGHENDQWFTFSSNGETYMFRGSDFTYDSNGDPTGGTITHIRAVDQSGANEYVANDINISVQQFETYAQTNDLSGFENAVFGGNDKFLVGGTSASYHNTNHFEGFGGNDAFDYNGYNAKDTFDGGGGYNTVNVFSSTLDVAPGMFENIQKLVLEPFAAPDAASTASSTIPTWAFTILTTGAQSFDMSRGQPVTIDGHLLPASENMYVEVGNLTGTVNLIGSAGDDVLIGGSGPDYITGGLGQDQLEGGTDTTFIYHSAAESTGPTCDILLFPDARYDHFQVPHAVTGMDAALTTGTLNYADFDTDLHAALKGHLEPHHAILFTPDSGDLAGTTFLVVDQNGVAGYQSGHDLVMDFYKPGSYAFDLTAANFSTPT